MQELCFSNLHAYSDEMNTLNRQAPFRLDFHIFIACAFCLSILNVDTLPSPSFILCIRLHMFVTFSFNIIYINIHSEDVYFNNHWPQQEGQIKIISRIKWHPIMMLPSLFTRKVPRTKVHPSLSISNLPPLYWILISIVKLKSNKQTSRNSNS